jgi:hypothetical protein
MSPTTVNKGELLDALDTKIVEGLLAGFTPAYVIIGWEDYIRLMHELNGRKLTKLMGVTIVVDPVHDRRMDVVARADMAIDFITSTTKKPENG